MLQQARLLDQLSLQVKIKQEEEKEKVGHKATVKKIRTDRAHIPSESSSFNIDQTVDSTMDRLKNIKNQCNACKEVGSTIKCLKESCKADYVANWDDFCNKCGANQNIEEARMMKRITKD